LPLDWILSGVTVVRKYPEIGACEHWSSRITGTELGAVGMTGSRPRPVRRRRPVERLTQRRKTMQLMGQPYQDVFREHDDLVHAAERYQDGLRCNTGATFRIIPTDES
jgi:hypothetical protein